jgi:hypothetical protein
MKTNVGKTDKTIRIILGLLIASMGIYFQSWWGLLAAIPFVTGFSGFCPLYSMLGIQTCKTSIKVK